MQTRLEKFIQTVRAELDHPSDLAACLTNGEIELPEWVSMSEHADHLRVWDSEDGSHDWGFIQIDYPGEEL